MFRSIVVLLVLLCGAANAQDRPLTTSFKSPVQGKAWKPDSFEFEKEYSYPDNDDVDVEWGFHLGEDMNLVAGTPIVATGDGKVMYRAYHPGTSKSDRNWGGIVILAHWVSKERVVFSLYGHLKLNPRLLKGTMVKQGDELGSVAPALSARNGWWEDAHLHFQFNLDPQDKYRGGVLAGYDKKREAPNRLLDNVAPSEVLGAADPVAFLVAEEANPKRK